MVKWTTAGSEVYGMARWVQAATRREVDPVEPMRACVVAPGRQWANSAERALRRRRFDVSAPKARLGFPHGPWDSRGTRRKPLEALARLCLLANGTDEWAWLAWFGLGLGDEALELLRAVVERCRQEKTSPLETLLGLDGGSDPATSEIVARRDEAVSFIVAKEGLRGFSLASALGLEEIPEFEEALWRLEEDDGARELLDRQLAAIESPSFANNESVRLATLDTLPLMEGDFDLVWLVAFNDGLTPDVSGLRRVQEIVDRAGRELVVSYFTQAPEDVAAKAGLAVSRVREVLGERTAVVRPSPLLDQLTFCGAALPGPISGEELLALL